MTATALIIFLLIGAIAGWLAGLIVRGFGFGLLGNIVIGIIGAFLGDLGTRAWRVLVQQCALPAIVLGLVANGFETSLWIGGGAAALEWTGGAGLVGWDVRR